MQSPFSQENEKLTKALTKMDIPAEYFSVKISGDLCMFERWSVLGMKGKEK